jgi:hypothetical protein
MTPTTLRPTKLLFLPLVLVLLAYTTAGPGRAQAEAVAGSSPVVTIEQPATSSLGTSAFAVTGWAIDSLAVSSAGIDMVNVYVWPSDAAGNVASGQAPVYSGAATYGVPRNDVAGTYGTQFYSSGYGLQVPALPAGTYLVGVFGHSNLVDNWSNSSRVVQVLAPSAPAASSALITLDSPASGNSATTFTVTGWSIDTGATADSGIDAVHVYIYASDAAGNVPTGATPVFFSGASLGGVRPDISGLYGGQFGASGFSLAGPSLADGYYLVSAYGHSAISGTWAVQSHVIQVGPVVTTAPGSVIPASQAQKGIPR